MTDFEAWQRFEREITSEARRLCRQGCRDEPCHCRAENDKDWRRDAINSLRARASEAE